MGLGARALREPHSGVTPKSGQTKQSSRQSRLVRRPLSMGVRIGEEIDGQKADASIG
jgi:hypothetical protein